MGKCFQLKEREGEREAEGLQQNLFSFQESIMTDVHFLTASLSLFERETESERVRQRERKLKSEVRNEREAEREQTVIFLWTGQVLITLTQVRVLV